MSATIASSRHRPSLGAVTVPLSVGIELAGDGVAEEFFAASPVRGVAGLAGRLESAGVHYWVIGADRAESSSGAALEPTVLATVAARHSTDLGLVVAAAAHRDHPYNLARRLISVDHAARGRVGWLALDADRRVGLDSPDTDTWTGTALDAEHTTDAVHAVQTLWQTWPLESVVGDHATGTFADHTRIRYADLDGTYAITGPLNVPGSVQTAPPVWRTAVDDHADLVLVEAGTPATVDGTVVRIRPVGSPSGTLPEALRHAHAEPHVVGVILRVAPRDLRGVLDEVLPQARAAGLVDVPKPGTLRQRLGLPPRTIPDLTHHRAFEGVRSAGGRL